MTNRKRLSLFLILLVFCIPLLSGLFSGTVGAAIPAQELRRRQLHTFAECLQTDVIDSDDEISDFGDLFKNNEDEREVIVVGRDRDSGNGVMTCDTVIRQGLKAYDSTAGDYRDWLMKQLTGKTLTENDGKALSDDKIAANRTTLYNKIKAAENALPEPTNLILRDRYAELVSICYTMEDIVRTSLGANDFKIEGVGFFYLKDASAVQNLFKSFIRLNSGTGSLTKAEIGDIELNWTGRAGEYNDFNADDSDFYPIGQDINATAGYTRKAIVDCRFVFHHRAVVFLNTKLEGGRLVDKTSGEELGGDIGSPSGTVEPSCESEGGEMSWMLCPALRKASSFITFLDNTVNDFLTLPSSYYNSPEVELAWSRMRDLAYAILIPIMLIMILATALGFDFVSAYTFKKAMPRLVVAILFIALSLEVTRFLVVLTNDVGQGVLGLITSAFAGAENITLASLFDPGGVISALFTGGVVVVGALAIGGLIPVLLLYLLSAGLALLIAVFSLALRQMLLISFMIIAPLAILGWIFPGNAKLWKLWWGSFSKLLILFPLIMFLIGSGRAFASLVQSSGPDDFIATTLKLAAYVGPFFFIPAMFKFAGGIFATVTGMANDRSKGIFAGLKNARKKQYGKSWDRLKKDKYFKGGKEGNLRGKFNSALLGTSLLPQAGLRPKRMGDLMQQARNRRKQEEAGELLKSGEGAVFGDDDFDEAVMRAGDDEGALRRILEERAGERFGEVNHDAIEGQVAAWRSLRRKHSAGVLALAAFHGGSNSSTMWNNDMVYETEDDGQGGTRFKRNVDGHKIVAKYTQADVDADLCEEAEIGTDKVARYNASGKMLEQINLIAGSDRMLSTQLLATARTNQSRAGREDTGGGGFSDTALEMDKLWRDDDYSLESATKGVTKSLIKGKNIYEIFRSGKPKVAQAVAPMLREMTEQDLQAAAASFAQAPVHAELAQVEADYQDTVRTIQETPEISLEERRVRVQRVTEQTEARVAALQPSLATAQAQQAQVVMRVIAREQMFHYVAATSSPDVAAIMGNQLFNTQFDMDLLPEQIRQVVVRKAGKDNPTHLEVFESLRDDPVWGAYVKEYGRVGGRTMSPEEIRAEAERRGITEAQLRAERAADERRAEEAARGPR